MRSTKLFSAAVGAALALTCGVSQALLTNASRPMSFTATGGFVQIPLNSNNALAVSFTVSASTKVIIAFTAECAVDGATGNGTQSRVDLQITMDGTPISPLNTGNETFCSSNHTTALDGPAMYAANVVTTVATGTHNVSVRAKGVRTSTGSNAQFSINSSTLIIFN